MRRKPSSSWTALVVLLMLCGRTDATNQCYCNDVRDPVCNRGTLKTYGNPCWARCDGADWVPGACGQPAEGGASGGAGSAALERHARVSMERQLSAAAAAAATTSVNGTNSTALAAHHGEGHVALCFLFVALFLGALTTYVLSRYATWVPYTCVLLVEGMILAVIHHLSNKGMGYFSGSLDQWLNIDAHTLLFCFLPALLFGDAMNLNSHMIQRCFLQCLTLATFGVLLGAFMTAGVAHLLPYDWTWHFCIFYGAIMAATDPVAVVALLKSLGASPKLTMIITGESLMNDGTAMILYNLFFGLYQYALPWYVRTGKEVETVGEIIEFFVRMLFGSPVVGLVFGYIALYMMGKASRKAEENDCIIQMCFTLVTAYLSFFVAEQVLRMSGVISCVSSAVVLARNVGPLICSHETMHNVWHAFEYIGNTIIFMLAGLLIGNQFFESALSQSGQTTAGLELRDYLIGVGMYLACLVIRSIMIAVLFPILSRLGYGITVKEAVVMAWGGLRGAVGLALAMIVRTTLKDTAYAADGERVMLHTGIVASLTLMVNGTTCELLLNKLGMTETPEAKSVLVDNMKSRIQVHAQKAYDKLAEDTEHYGWHDPTEVKQLCSILSSDEPSSPKGSKIKRRKTQLTVLPPGRGVSALTVDELKPNAHLLHMVREIFLHVLRASYWHQIEDGKLPEESAAALMLLNSVDMAMDDSYHKLNDWEKLASVVEPDSGCYAACLRKLDRMLPESVDWDNHFNRIHKFTRQEQAFYVVTNFCEAHAHAQHEISYYFGESTAIDTLEEAAIIEESRSQVVKAQAAIRLMDNEMVRSIVSKQVAEIVLEKQRRYIHDLMHGGLLSQKEGAEMLEAVAQDLAKRYAARRKQSKFYARKQTDQIRLHQQHMQLDLRSVIAEAEGVIAQAKADKASVDFARHVQLLNHCCIVGVSQVLVKDLIEIVGLEPNRADATQTTPLHYAAWWGRTELVRLLLTGLDTKIEPNGTNREGNTALHFAYMREKSEDELEIIELLLHNGAEASVDICNNKGLVPSKCVEGENMDIGSLIKMRSTANLRSGMRRESVDGPSANRAARSSKVMPFPPAGAEERNTALSPVMEASLGETDEEGKNEVSTGDTESAASATRESPETKLLDPHAPSSRALSESMRSSTKDIDK